MACGTEIGFTKSGCLQTPWLIVAGKPIIPKATVENASLISSHPSTVHRDVSVKSGECAACEDLQERRGLGWCCCPGPPGAAGLVSDHAVPTAGMGS